MTTSLARHRLKMDEKEKKEKLKKKSKNEKSKEVGHFLTQKL